MRDRSTGVTRRVSVGPRGAQANRDSFTPVDLRGRPLRGVPLEGSNLVAGTRNVTTTCSCGTESPR